MGEKKAQSKLKVLSNLLKSVDLSCFIQSAPFTGRSFASRIGFKVSLNNGYHCQQVHVQHSFIGNFAHFGIISCSVSDCSH